MTAPLPPRRGGWNPRWLTLSAVVVGWFAILLAYRGSWLGLGLAVLTTVLAYEALAHGRARAQAQSAELRAALHAAGRRHRELDHLRRIASALLEGRDVPALQRAVAAAAAELLEAEIGAVLLLVEEGRYLRIVAASGAGAAFEGRLVPVAGSLLGRTALEGRPFASADLAREPGAWSAPDLPALRNAAMVPLRSAGLVIGVVAVYNRPGGTGFGDDDLALLGTLGDQVVVGLDRAAMLEESQRTSEALARKNRELVQATELKSKFLANMSHELRTPLNAIIGFSELLEDDAIGPLNDTQRDFLQSVIRNARHLLGLINSVLDLAKIEAGRLTLQLARTDLRAAVVGAVTDTASLRTAKDQACTVEMDDGDPLTVLADELRVRQILFNLLSNASKFTPEGGQVRVSALRTRAPMPGLARRAGDTERLVPRDVVWIAVSDTGIGIRREDLDKLFEEFSQVNDGFSRQQQGTGLGLALSRRFVEMHGGTIGAESVPGAGSTFWFMLPVDGPLLAAGAEG